ncbi:MAG: phosphoribosylanthranilate isomerase [Aquificae bacterium]|nr:phosphoribosylanthranilate isomerase [Aquificota bacterium]
MVKVKICGITNVEDALAAVEAGADYIGFIFFPPSPRNVDLNTVREILKNLPKGVKNVAVTVNAEVDFLKKLLEEGFDLLQLHGDENPSILKDLPKERVIKVFRVRDSFNEENLKGWEGIYAYLLDTYKKGTYGGTGETFNWDIARGLVEKGLKIFLSGGLKPENVARAVEIVKPYAVDVSSGVEAYPGKKDLKKLEEFIKKAKKLG